MVLSFRVLCCWTESHVNNIWRNRTSARTHIFRLSACTYWFTIQPAHTFPLRMRLCPAFIVWKHSKSHWKYHWFSRLYRCLLNCAIASRAVLLNLITCDDNLAVLDVRAYAHLSSLSWYVFIYYTALSHFSVVNASLPSLDCITAFKIALEILLICEGCIHAYLCCCFACCLNWWTWLHATNTWRYRTSARSRRMCFETIWTALELVFRSLRSLNGRRSRWASFACMALTTHNLSSHISHALEMFFIAKIPARFIGHHQSSPALPSRAPIRGPSLHRRSITLRSTIYIPLLPFISLSFRSRCCFSINDRRLGT